MNPKTLVAFRLEFTLDQIAGGALEKKKHLKGSVAKTASLFKGKTNCKNGRVLTSKGGATTGWWAM